MSTRRGRKRKQELKPREEEQLLEAAFESVEHMEVKVEIESNHLANTETQCVDEGQLTSFNEEHDIDVKPDLDELQQEILRQQELVSRTLYQQTEENSIAQTKSVGKSNTQSVVVVASQENHTSFDSSAAAPIQLTRIAIKTHNGEPKELNVLKTENELDQQESDWEEDGYSEIDFDADQIFEDDDDEVDVYDPLWHEQPLTPRLVFTFNVNNSDIGLKRCPKENNPIFYFNLILRRRSDFFKELASGCNVMFGHYFGNIMKENNPINDKEMQTFIGLCLQMCKLKLLTISEYWNETLNYGFVGFANKMSYDRFRQILRCLNFYHLSVKSMINQNDPLCDVNPLLEFFNNSMSDLYTCGQRIVLNEPMTYWKGKFKWHSDMKDKFRLNALNLHFLTEPSGMVLKVQPEIQDCEMKMISRNSRLLVDKRNKLALHLLKDSLNNGRTVYVSKYYGSYGLAYVLTKFLTYCTGFLDSKRYGNSKELVMTPLERNSYETKYAAPVMMAKWRRIDKSFYFFSSDCLAISRREMIVAKVDSRPKIMKDIALQLKVSENNREYMTNYQLGLQTGEMTCNQQLVVYIFNLIVLNAYILYSKSPQFTRARPVNYNNEQKSYGEFRQAVIKSLLKDESDVDSITPHINENYKIQKLDGEGGTKIVEKTSSPDKKVSSEIVHVPTMIPSRHGKQLKKKCRVCFSKAGLQTLSKYVCELCPGMPGLCNVPCFTIWHGKMLNSHEIKPKQNTKCSLFLPKNVIKP